MLEDSHGREYRRQQKREYQHDANEHQVLRSKKQQTTLFLATIGQQFYKQACVPTATHRSILAQYNQHVTTHEGSKQSQNFYNWNTDFGANIWHPAATIVSILSVAVHTSSAAPREKTKLHIVKNLSFLILRL